MRAFAGIFLLLLAFGTSSWAKTDAEVAAAIQVELEQRHPKDTPDWWRGLGANAPGVIMGMYERDRSTYHRVRLVNGLGYFDDPKATDFLKNLALNSEQDVILNAALKSIGQSQGAAESEFLSRFLGHNDPSTRFAAAQALQGVYERTRDARAKDFLDKYRKEEKVPWVLSKLKGQLPEPAKGLSPVATSEDASAQNLEGTWKGYLVSPHADVSKGMKSEPAIVKFQGDSPAALKAELILKVKEKYRTVTLSKITWKGPASKAFAASWAEGKDSFSIEGEVTQQAGAELLTVRVARLGATLIVRKESSSR